MALVGDIERTLNRLRTRQEADGTPELRTSTATHLVWAPPRWLPQARATLHGLAERHPSRVVFLVPEPGRGDHVDVSATIRDFDVGDDREVLSEVIEIRLRGTPRHHPGSIVLPLLIADLPAFCRWRGKPEWGSSAFMEIVGACDRLVVDSGEWTDVSASYSELSALFERVAISDIAFRRTLQWRARLAELWPDIGRIEHLRVEGPQADAELLAGWLRSRLHRKLRLTRRRAPGLAAIWVDGEPVETPLAPALSASDLLSAELDVLSRDRVYEGAVRAAATTTKVSRPPTGPTPPRRRAARRGDGRSTR